MFYKLVKSDAKIVKAILETNGFQQTENHDWSLIWSS
jgi:hypothetical protein